MRVINISVRPKINLKRRPPHRNRRNIFSDLFALNFSNKNPITKFKSEIKPPNNIDLKTRDEMTAVKSNSETTRTDKKVKDKKIFNSCLSLLIISCFQNRFDECIHTCKNPQECKYYS
jgi:hypothetical protein